MNMIRRIISLLALIVWATVMPIVFFIAKLVPGFDEQKMPRLFHKGVCWIAGLKVTFSGSLSTETPTLFVSNHVSYLDIFAMGQRVPGYFVAKSEVASWPVLSKLAKLQNTIFIERKASKAKSQTKLLQDQLASGNNIILYPEGTSTNGAEVKSFKSSLFSVAETDRYDLTIQAMSITYTKFKNQGMDQTTRDNFAWYADMPFASHFLNVLTVPKVEVDIKFHAPVKYSDFNDRKGLASHCENQTRLGVVDSLENSGSRF